MERAAWALMVICAVTAFILFAVGSYIQQSPPEERAAPVMTNTEPVQESKQAQAELSSESPKPAENETEQVITGGTTVLPTTIEGGLTLRNDTSFSPDIEGLMAQKMSQSLPKDGAQILIIHTHGSESYMPDQFNNYEASDTYRTQDERYNMLRVGDELAACFESYGLSVIHDREIYDYPSYTGSYGRSADAANRHLSEHPEIAVILDVHRDAIGSGDVIYKTVAGDRGEPCSQIMLLVGTGENGLEHPNWQENLKFALYLQNAVMNKYPSLMRPVSLKKERYNQQLTTASLIIEVGSSGNTLPEALRAVRLFAESTSPALLELVK